MDLENTQNNSLAKLPLLKQGEYDTWRLRIESYIQLQDYTLWEIIEEGNTFKPVARTTTDEDGTSTTTILGVVTAEQKILKKNDLKARSILMMTLPSEHLLTFNKHKDAKSLFEAIEARFGDNKATKKTQKTLLKQMYETFNASSAESLDSIFNRLQKIISQLTILGEIITSEELNLKFLRSLPTKWGMHVVVWRNKSDLGSISFDDIYNNFKIIEPEVKRSVTSCSNSGSQNLAFVLGHSSTNDVNAANVHISIGSTPVSTASTNNSTAYLSDAIVYAYLATQLNRSQVVHEDLEQIHEDDLDEMDLKCDTAGYDKKKVECFNCHKLGHFARECRNPKSQENRSRSQDSSRRIVNVEESSSKAMLAIDGTGFDWSYMADEEASTNFALMAFSDSKGLASGKEQLVFYKKNEGMLCDQIVVLKSDASFNESDINALKKQPEFEGYGVKVSDCDEDENVVLESLDVQKPKQADQPRKVSQNHRNNSTSWNTPMPKNLGVTFQFTPKACFVCGSFNHRIKDYDFHDKRMVQKPVLNNVKKGTGQREIRPVWNNVMRVNHQNFSNSRRNFAPTVVLTKSGLVPFSTVRQSFSRTTAPVSVASTVGEQGINVVKPTSYWAWRPKIKMINHVYKNTGSCISLAIPGQTATSKESSNLFMAGSLPKTINSNNVDEESQKIGRQAQVMISDAEEYLISEDPVKQGRMEETENA
ncbi:ribonuclease H-like domain-containing protein [Tanacetum coccineum]|uniref:Ribonuclease H-like domain-containing protein n=1 Tax=Tanacetum coccineum TaxID=301880 RepID=A0ABQ5ERX1_9ASTR